MRDKASKALISCGIPMSQSGFLYILDSMELFEQNGAPITSVKTLYNLIARARRRSPYDVMYHISYTIQYALKNGIGPECLKYFGLGITPMSNGNYLAMMWQRLKEEE